MPIISIVIPLYNAEAYISKCLESISRQTFKDFEVVMVDDCSSDNSIALAEKRCQELNLNYQILCNKKNIGPSLTRKNGINSSKGQYIVFCDSDDFFNDDHLEKLIGNSDNLNNDIVFCSYKTVYSSGVEKKHNVTTAIKSLNKKGIIARGTDSLCCMMVKSKVFEQITFPDIRNGEDMSIIPVIISLSNKYGFSDECSYNYVYHANTLSKKPNLEIVNILKESFLYIKQRLETEYPMETEFLAIRNYLYGGMLNLLKTKAQLRQGRVFYKEFKKMYPLWYRNPYVKTLPSYKKMYLTCVRLNLFVICKALSIIHMKLSQ